MISLLIISFGRYQEVLETFACVNKYHGNKIELLFLDNNPARELETALSSILENNSSILFSYFHTGENLGVAEGRNFLIEKAQGDILITLDDDVEIEDITLLIQKVTNYMANNAKIGALAFNIKNYFTRKTLSHEIPHGNKKLDFSKIQSNKVLFVGGKGVLTPFRRPAPRKSGTFGSFGYKRTFTQS